MKTEILDRTETFMNTVESALGLPASQTREITDELRSDLLSQVSAHCDQGLSESAALDLALEELGDPATLAKNIKASVPPLSSGWTRIVRYVLGSGLIAWSLFLLWSMRPWSYGAFGFGTSVLLLSLHLVPVLVVWPGTIWKKNWLFGWVPAAACAVIFLMIHILGTTSTMTIDLDAPSQPAATETGVGTDSWQLRALPFIAAALALWLIACMQQQRQRRAVIACALLVLVSIEAVFQVEEMLFRRDRDHLLQTVADYSGQNGTLPDRDTLIADGDPVAGKTNVHYGVDSDGDSFTLLWARPLQSGFSIVYSSDDGRLWVND